MSLVTVTGLSKSFGESKAVDGISFSLAAGELLALIGPNGAGKSTTFNMIDGQIRASAGSVQFDGKELVGLEPREIWRLGVGRTFQVAETFASLTVAENVQMALLSADGKLFSMWREAAAHKRAEAVALLALVGMAAQADRPCSVLAYGDVKRVELAIAMANHPKLLLMDEPTAGMAPKERNELMALARKLATESNMAVLFTEHSMDVVFAYADRVIVLARGRLIAEGKPTEIRDHPKVREVYFGSGKTFEKARNSQADHAREVAPASTTRGLSDAVAEDKLLSVRALNAWYGAAQILFKVDLNVGRGEVVALLGRNGAGKSTTLKAIMGLVPERRGTLSFMGCDISAAQPHEIAARGLGFVPEERRIFTDLSVMENLDVGRQPVRYWPDRSPAPVWTPERLFKLFPNLGEMANRLGGRMSGGEQQMLTVARTLMGNPYLVLMDEPSEGMAPVIVEQMVNMILELKAEGVSILLSEQNMHFAQLVADRAYILEKGEIRFDGSMEELARNQTARQAYLGV